MISSKLFEKLMDEIKQMQAKIQEISKLQEEVGTNQDNMAQKIVKKLKANCGYMFQKIGREQ